MFRYRKSLAGFMRSLIIFWVVFFVISVLYVPKSPLSNIETALATDGTGMYVYDEDGANNTTPHYRIWSGSDLSGESQLQDDETASDDTNHTIIEAAPTRDEYLMGRLTNGGHLDVQVYSGGSWINGTNAPTNGDFTTGIGTTNDIYRGFDIAYEDSTGDGVVLYESSSTGDGHLKYRTWNGSTWSGEGDLDYSAVDEGNDVAAWVECEADFGSDNILCAWREKTNLGLYGARWDGSTWQHISAINTANGMSTRQDFDVAWEGTSGEGMVVYGLPTTFVDASTYTTASGFADTSSIATITGAPQWIEIAGSPNNNYIAVYINNVSSTTAADVDVDMWNGSNWTTVATPATMDDDINNNGFAQGGDVAWEQGGGDRALFVWRDGTVSETALRYMFYDVSANQWQAIEDGTECANTEGGAGSVEVVTSLAAAEDSAGPCTAALALADSFSGIDLNPDPGSNKIMVLAEDLTADLMPELFLYNGDANATWTQTATMAAPETDLSTGATLSASLPTKAYDFAFRQSTPTTTASTTGSQTANMNIGATNQYVGGAFSFSTDSISLNVTAITITESGTVNAQSNLDNIKLYYENDTSSAYDCASESYAGTETQFGSTDTDGFSAASGTATFSGSVAITSTSTMCVYVVLDVGSGAANGETIEISIAATGDYTVSAGNKSGTPAISGTTTIQAPSITVSGTVYQSDETTTLASKTVHLRVNGTLTGTGAGGTGIEDSDGSGNFSFTSVFVSAGDTITLYLDGETETANTITITDGSTDATSVPLYDDHVVIRSDNSSTAITILDLVDYDNDNDATDMLFTATDSSPDTLVVEDGAELHIYTADTFTPGGTVTTSPSADGTDSNVDGDLHIDGTGTLSMGTNTLSVGGDYTNEGTFSKSTGQTTTFTATATGHTITDGGENFDTVVFNGSNGGWSFADSTTIDVDLTMTAGTLSGTSSTTVNGGDVTGDGDINLTGGTFLLDTAGNFGGATAWDFSTLTFGDGSGATTTTTTGAGGVTVSTSLTIAANQTLDAKGKTWTLSGTTGTPLTISGTLNDSTDTSTFEFTGNNGGGNTTVPASTAYNNLTLNNGSETFALGGTVTMSGDLTVTAGTLSGTSNVTVNGGAVTGDGTITLTDGTFLVDTTGNFGGATAWTFDNLTFGDGTGSTTTTATGAGAITVSGSMTIATNQILDAGSKTWNLTATGGSGTIALVNQLAAHAPANADGFTSSSIDTSGANLIVVGVAEENASVTTLSDSKTNTWTQLTTVIGNGNKRATLFYAKNAIVGTGHTFTVTGTDSFPSISVLAFSGADTSSPFDDESGLGNVFSSSNTMGNVSPSVDGEVLVAFLNYDWTDTPTISTLTTINAQPKGDFGYLGSIGAYQIQTTKTDRNETWSWTNSSTNSGVIATFKPGASGVLTVSGTLTENASTFVYKGDGAVTVTPETYYNLTLNPTLTTDRTYTMGGAVTATGAFNINPDASSTTKTLTVNLGGTTAVTGALTIQKTGTGAANLDTVSAYALSAGSITISSGGTLTGRSSTITDGGNWTNNGTFATCTCTVVFNGAGTSTIAGATTFYNLTAATGGQTLLFTAGENFTIASGGLLTLTGVSGASMVHIDSTDGSTQWTINHQGTESIAYVHLHNSGCHGSSTTITMDANSTSVTNNGTCWSFPAGGITVSGTAYSTDGSTNLGTGKTIALRKNGTLIGTGDGGTGLDDTDASGNWSFTSISASAGDTLTIYLNGETEKGNTITITDGATNATSVPVYQNHLIIKSDNSTTAITIVDLTDYDNDQNSTDMLFDAEDASPDTLIVEDGIKLFIHTGDTFTPGGSVTTDPSSSAAGLDGDLEIDGTATLSMGTNALSVGGDYVNDGTFSKSTGQTTTFTATATGHSITDGGENFDTVVFNGTNGGWSFADSTTIDVDLTMTAGTLSGTNSITVNGGDVTGDGTINLTGGTFLVDTAGNFGGATAWTFSTLTFGDGSGATTTTSTGAGGVTVSSVLTIAANQTLDTKGKTWTLSGTTGASLVISGTFNDSTDTGTIAFTGNNSGGNTTVPASTAYNNITLNNSSETFVLGGTMTISGDLVVTDGTLTDTDNVTVNGGDVTGNGTINMTGGTFIVDGTGSFGGSTGWTFNNLTFGDASGTATSTATGAGSVTVSSGMTIAANQTLNAGSKSWVLSGTGSGSGTIALVTQLAAHAAANSDGFTSSSIDTSGANLIVVGVAEVSAAVTTLTDSKSNTWNQLTTQVNNNKRATLFYATNPTVGSGHTFTVTGTDTFPSISVLAFSGADTSSPFDVENGTANLFSNSNTMGNVTPSTDNEVLVAFMNYDTTETPTISTLTTINSQPKGDFGFLGSVGAYQIQTTATARNETWSWTTSSTNAGVIAAFKPSTGSPSPLTVNGTLTASSSNFNFTGNGDLTIPNQSYYDLTFSPTVSSSGKSYTLGSGSFAIGHDFNINPTAASALNLSVILGGNTTVTGTTTIQKTSSATSSLSTNGSNYSLSSAAINIASGGTLTANNSTITLTGSGNAFTATGTFNIGGSTVAYTSTGATNIENTTYNHLSLTPGSGNPTYTTDSGTIRVDGTATFGGGTTMTIRADSNNSNFDLRGSVTLANNATFTKGSGTMTLKAGTTQTLTDSNSTKQDLGAIQVSVNSTNTTLSLGSSIKATSITVDNSQNLTLGSNTLELTGTGSPLSLGNGTFTVTGSTIQYSGTTATVTATTFNNLTLGGTGTYTMPASATTLRGNLAITSGSTVTKGAGTIVFAKGGGGTQTITDSTATKQDLGNVQVSANAGTSTVNLASDASLTTLIVDSSQTFSLNGSNTLTITGNGTVLTPTGSFDASTGTLNFVSVGTSGTTIPAQTYHNLTVNKASNTFTVSSGTFIANGTLTVTAGTLDLDANDPTTTATGGLSIAGTVSASSANPLTISGNFTNNGIFTHNNGTVVFSPTASTASITGSTATTNFYNFTASNQADKTLRFKAGNTYGVSGLLTLSGSFAQPLDLQSDSAGSQWYITFTGTASITNIKVKDGGCSSSNNIAVSESVSNQGNNGSCWLVIHRGGGGAVGGGGDGGSSGGGSGQTGGGQGGAGDGGSGGGTGETGGGSGGSGGGGSP
jgi:hypothetical protein